MGFTGFHMLLGFVFFLPGGAGRAADGSGAGAAERARHERRLAAVLFGLRRLRRRRVGVFRTAQCRHLFQNEPPKQRSEPLAIVPR